MTIGSWSSHEMIEAEQGQKEGLNFLWLFRRLFLSNQRQSCEGEEVTAALIGQFQAAQGFYQTDRHTTFR